MMLDFPMLVEKYNIQSKGCWHIGASEGQESKLYNEFGINKVVWFEAISDVYKKLVEHTKDLHLNLCINACISDEDGKDVIFHVANNEGQSSSILELGEHAQLHPSVYYTEHIPMKTERVDTIINNTKETFPWITDCDFLNCDLQGNEYAALVGMGDYLKNFKYAILEINKRECYQGCATVEVIDEYMSRFGFSRVETGDWVGDLWTDGFYLKK